jgi:hypothetical protein
MKGSVQTILIKINCMPISANIILTETHGYRSKNNLYAIKTKQLIFYRQSDGNPESVIPILNVFIRWIKEGRFKNLGQCGGWLVILGAIEHNAIPKFLSFKEKLGYNELSKIQLPKVCRFGSFEPASAISGNIDYLYEIDIKEVKLTTKKVSYINGGEQIFDSGQPVRIPTPELTFIDRVH